MSRVLPILFNTDMVRAILDGRKTATRRIMKLSKHIKPQEDGLYTLFADGTCYENHNMEEIINYLKPPYRPGNILYVRESGIIQSMKNVDKSVKIYFPLDGKLIEFKITPDEYERLCKFPEDKKLSPYWFTKQESRIWLKVTDVRVERLQDIKPVDVIREGAYPDCLECLNTYGESGSQCCYNTEDECSSCDEVMMEWEKLWNSTIKKSDLNSYGWDANPWVWVIEFERCEKPEEL